jgi:hypothetical protein
LNGQVSEWSGQENPMVSLPKFPDLLRESGYHARRSLKTIGFVESKQSKAEQEIPTVEYQRYGLYVSEAKDEVDRARRVKETLDHPRNEMRRVLTAAQARQQPFFFIYGTINVHRPWKAGSGQALWGIDPETLKGKIPKFLPDVEEIRRDFSDYLGEVQAADAMLEGAKSQQAGEAGASLQAIQSRMKHHARLFKTGRLGQLDFEPAKVFNLVLGDFNGGAKRLAQSRLDRELAQRQSAG